jgi:hypothetical protein
LLLSIGGNFSISAVSSTLAKTSCPVLAGGLDDAAGLEAHGNVLDQRAGIGQRLGAADMAFNRRLLARHRTMRSHYRLWMSGVI